MNEPDVIEELIEAIEKDFVVSPELYTISSDEKSLKSVIKISNELCVKISTSKKLYEISSRIISPNLCFPLKVYELQSGKYYGYIQQFLNLYNIQQIIKKRVSLPEREAGSIIQDVLNGLKELHRNGLLHRDMHPANVMLHSQNGRTKAVIIDFDEIEFANSNTKACFCYSGYQAPEIVLQNAVYDEKTEIFAVGVMFWELLFGYCPFAGYDYFGQHIELSWEAYRVNKVNIEHKIKTAISQINKYKDKLQAISTDCAELLWMMINPNKNERVSVEVALNSAFYNNIVHI